MTVNFEQQNINSELVLLTVDTNDHEKKLLILTSKAENDKEFAEQVLLVNSLISINFKGITSQEMLDNLTWKIKFTSPLDFICLPIPKENVEESKRKFLSFSSSITTKKELTELWKKESEEYFTKFCYPCQTDIWIIKEVKNKEAIYRLFSCSDLDCIGSATTIKKDNFQV